MKVLTGAKVLIRRKTDGRYLILTSSPWPGNSERSQKPDLPGGAIEPGEKIEDGLIREIQEETGLVVRATSLQLGHSSTRMDKDSSLSFMIFSAEIAGDELISLSHEHESYEWLSVDQLLALEMREPYPDLFRYMNKIGLVV